MTPSPLLFALLCGAAATLLLAVRPARLALFWGAAWGCFFGFWFLMPLMLRVHHMPALSLRQWLLLDAGFAGVFIIAGAVLAALCSLPLVLAWTVSGRRPRNMAWVCSIWIASCLPLLYLLLSVIVEWTSLRRPVPLDAYISLVWPGLVAYGSIIGVSVVVFRVKVTTGWDTHGRQLAAVVVLLALIGCGLAPLRVRGPAVAEASAPPLTPLASPGASRPLLVIGLDGGNWRTLEPVLKRGGAPTLARLIDTGVRGEVKALWAPYWSTPAWASILTGHPREDVGVYEDLTATMSGFPAFELPLQFDLALNPLFSLEFGLIRTNVIEPTPAPRTRLPLMPVWQRLSTAGVRTAVVRFPFTYPAQGQADYVISNRAVVDLWDEISVETGATDQLVAPETIRPLLGKLSRPAGPVDDLLKAPNWPQPPDSLMNSVEVVKRVAHIDSAMNDMLIDLMTADPAIRVAMIHVTGFDAVSHALWQYRFPEDFPGDPPAAADIEQLGPVIDRYLARFDAQVERLIASFPSTPNVIIVADHGEGPSHLRTIWRGWHATPGLFIAAGPDIDHQPDMRQVSYYDIVPTILQLQNFAVPVDIRGRSAVSAPAAPLNLSSR